MRFAGRQLVIGRYANVVRVDFSREPDPPAPRFPGAGALRVGFIESIENDAAGAIPSPRRVGASGQSALKTAATTA